MGAPTLGLGGPSPQSAIFLYAFHHKQFLRSLRWEFNKILPRVIVVVKICKVVTYIFVFLKHVIKKLDNMKNISDAKKSFIIIFFFIIDS